MILLKESGIKMSIVRQKRLGSIPQYLFISILLLGLISCASTSQVNQEMNFPNDISEPFLRLQQVIDGEEVASRGFLGRLMGFIVGPDNRYQMNQPTDMVVDAMGRLLIVDSEAGLIAVFTRVEERWVSSKQISIPGVNHPIGIAASPDHLYLSDLSSGVVTQLDYDFKVLEGIQHAEMKRPGGLFFDQQRNRLFVVDPPANRVFAFNDSGELLSEIGRSGTNQSLLQRPISITVDPGNGDLYILDGLARKVKHYDVDYNFVSSFGEYDQVPGTLAFPKGIALSSDGVLFIADAAFGNIQLFDPSGALLFYFGETGTESGQFLMPRNLFMDVNQHLFVADPYNNRVQVFQYFAQQ